jgi:6,7-dimethyl-8-ribityllumazine synthase
MKNFAIVVSQFNQTVTDKLLAGALSHLQQAGVPGNNISVFKVPGAVEIPLIAQLVAKTKKYHAVICLGAVVRGDTSHYDYVCKQVSQGCQRVMLDFSLPVIFGVLTTETEQQAEDRAGGTEGNKGADAAAAALTMVQLIENLPSN